MRLKVYLNLTFWGLPICLRWRFAKDLNDYIVFHFLCLEFVLEWI